MAFENLKRKLANGEKINIGYFGGSITEGAGVTDKSLCWRAKLTEWFRNKYPENTFDEINAAIGGTGTELGMFRIGNDLLSKKPDVVFVEFAVNDDSYGRKKPEYCMESIVRQILSADEKTDIVFVMTITSSMHGNKKQGKELESYTAHHAVAEYYGIECIDAGIEFTKRIDAGEGDWKTYTIDNVHPNEYGYKLYFDKISSEIEKLIENGKTVCFAPPMHDDSFKCAGMVDSFTLSGNFEKVEESLCTRYPRYIKMTKKGEFVEYEGEFDCVGMYNSITSTSGDVTVTIDGKDYGCFKLWDKYALEFNRAGHTLFDFELEKGIHKVRIEATGTSDERSKGTDVCIGTILVASR